MALSKKLRFEVFKRDKFTCQYCGIKAPDVILHVDHIRPRSKGGPDDLINLVTCCVDCNLGKGPRELSDDSAVVKQRSQSEDLQERREQVGMMIDWQHSLMDLDSEVVDHACELWCDLVGWDGVNGHGRKLLRQWIRKYGLEEVISAMRKSTEAYVKLDASGEPTDDSREHAFDKITGICHISRVEKEKPYMKDVFYIRGVLKNRLDYVNLPQARELLEVAFTWGGSRDEMYQIAANCSNYTKFKNQMYDYIDELQRSAED